MLLSGADARPRREVPILRCRDEGAGSLYGTVRRGQRGRPALGGEESVMRVLICVWKAGLPTVIYVAGRG